MRCVVFGATGKTGRLVVDELLAEGHDVVAVARDPRRVQPRPGLRVVAGDVTDGASVAAAMEGADVVVSAAGQVRGSPPDLLTRFATHLVEGARHHGVKRVVSLVGAGVDWPTDDAPTLSRRFVRLMMSIFAPAVLPDAQGHVEALAASGVPFVLARPPRLTDGPKTGRIRAAPYLALGPSDVLSRADLAAFLVSQLEDPAFLGAAPMVTTERP